jgi:hypothetical protein
VAGHAAIFPAPPGRGNARPAARRGAERTGFLSPGQSRTQKAIWSAWFQPEKTIARLRWFRRLRIRREIRDDIHEAFLSLACACFWRRLASLSLV